MNNSFHPHQVAYRSLNLCSTWLIEREPMQMLMQSTHLNIVWLVCWITTVPVVPQVTTIGDGQAASSYGGRLQSFICNVVPISLINASLHKALSN